MNNNTEEQVTTEPSSSNEKEFPSKRKSTQKRNGFKGNPKKHRFDSSSKPSQNNRSGSKDGTTAGVRHGGTYFEKLPLPTFMSLPARRSYYMVYSSNFGLVEFVPRVYQAMISKDFRLGHIITLPQLQYVTSIALLNRVQQCAIEYGTIQPSRTSDVKALANGIVLPDVICKYIEAFGMYTMLNGLRIIPLVGRHYDEHYPLDQAIMIDPAQYLVEEHRPIPDNDWKLDNAWVNAFNEATLRAKTGMSFRKVDNSEKYHGSSAMVSSYRHATYGIVAYSAEALPIPEAQLNACYALRNVSVRHLWIGEDQHLVEGEFLSTAFEPQSLISALCVESFASRYS